MATFNFQNATLKISYETGVDEAGKPVFTSKTYNNVRENVTPTQVAAVIQGIASLSNYPLSAALKTETEEIQF
ncbi:hypothetical protein JOD29_003213 [Lysinibacillus composti]|nr:DUF1659 domain-containing protein [Lysinibacillus composti]MBM7609937.1 hypothetical protein [Lysinibacillus composti]